MSEIHTKRQLGCGSAVRFDGMTLDAGGGHAVLHGSIANKRDTIRDAPVPDPRHAPVLDPRHTPGPDLRQPTGQEGVIMSSARKTALVAGLFYLTTFAASIPALILIGPVLHNPDYITGPGADARVIAGCLLDLVNAIAAVGTAVALFPVVRRQNEGFALGFLAARSFEAAVIVIGVVSLLAVVSLRQEAAGGQGTDPSALVTTGRALVAVRDWTFLLGPGLVPAINALCLGVPLHRSGLVPRIIPAIGLAGAPLLVAAAAATLFGVNTQTSLLSGVATIPIFAWELSVGVYMTVKGFRPSPIIDTTAAASAPPTRCETAA
jgi:hypothetical protein